MLVTLPAATVPFVIAPAAHKLALNPALTLTFVADACAETLAVPLLLIVRKFSSNS
ncbi:MAG: hypothetical protein NT013_00180 [Planctomycetia bacterium]|nr:hypothetical protein [Planctomycetia bacterium]